MQQELIKKSLAKRYKSENLFVKMGMFAIIAAVIFLVIFLSTIVVKGNKAFVTHKILLEIDFSQESIVENSMLSENFYEIDTQDLIEEIAYRELIEQALRKKFIQSKSLQELESIYGLVADIAEYKLQDLLTEDPSIIGNKKEVWLNVASQVDIYLKYSDSNFDIQEASRIDTLVHNGEIESFFNRDFFTSADSREPESAGISASLMGSFFVMAVFLILAFPLGVMSAFYLEEFAPKGRVTDLIEISINNLAAIPSIIYGLLGLTIYLQFMNLPRSSALVGGMTLSMLVLPVIIIATRNAIRSIPQSIRDGAVAVGATKMQVVLHHLLPLSMPGIMTGTILSMSRALGETAPLLMIGMIAFIADVPAGLTDPTTVLPVQIYLWSDSPEIGFAEKTSAAIMVLLGFLILFNLIAIVIRKKFERQW